MAAEIVPMYSRQERIQMLLAGLNPAVEFTGDLTLGNANILNATNATKLAVGMKVYYPLAAGGAAAPTITAIVGTTVTLSTTAGFTQVGQRMAAFLTPGAAALQGANVNLYQSTLVPGVGTNLATLTANIATFDGYAAKILAMETGYINGAQQAIAESQLLVWTPTASITGNTIGGAWADDGTGVIAIWPLDTPVTLLGPATTLKILVTEAVIEPGQCITVLP